ncbi:hypothetical protein HNR42_002364 [Deinobacterium chartae]|uniref:Uncharacterized protein n=1 Tax=Deinobacterium chartae TaxID=521158 RepID=A0A841I3M6_9DEIO|nr:hypothetical protein [Deinobacterium chartae]MBB6098929.1 hypothetical protein [Deinobacterium chartae]
MPQRISAVFLETIMDGMVPRLTLEWGEFEIGWVAALTDSRRAPPLEPFSRRRYVTGLRRGVVNAAPQARHPA